MPLIIQYFPNNTTSCTLPPHPITLLPSCSPLSSATLLQPSSSLSHQVYTAGPRYPHGLTVINPAVTHVHQPNPTAPESRDPALCRLGPAWFQVLPNGATGRQVTQACARSSPCMYAEPGQTARAFAVGTSGVGRLHPKRSVWSSLTPSPRLSGTHALQGESWHLCDCV
jgi:hypothetical protein